MSNKPFEEMTPDEQRLEIERRNDARRRGVPALPGGGVGRAMHVDTPNVQISHRFAKKTGMVELLVNDVVDDRLEKVIQNEVRKRYIAAGCVVYWLSQARKTKQTVGLPDLYVIHPARAWWHETKSATGRLRMGQAKFNLRATIAGVDVVIGGLTEADRYLMEHKLSKALADRVLNGLVEAQSEGSEAPKDHATYCLYPKGGRCSCYLKNIGENIGGGGEPPDFYGS